MGWVHRTGSWANAPSVICMERCQGRDRCCLQKQEWAGPCVPTGRAFSAGLSLSRARLSPRVNTQPMRLSCWGRRGAGLGGRDCDSRPHQSLVEVLRLLLAASWDSIRAQPVVNKPPNAIQARGRWGAEGGSKGLCQTQVSSGAWHLGLLREAHKPTAGNLSLPGVKHTGKHHSRHF